MQHLSSSRILYEIPLNKYLFLAPEKPEPIQAPPVSITNAALTAEPEEMDESAGEQKNSTSE